VIRFDAWHDYHFDGEFHFIRLRTDGVRSDGWFSVAASLLGLNCLATFCWKGRSDYPELSAEVKERIGKDREEMFGLVMGREHGEAGE